MVSHHDGIPTRRDFPAIECGVNVAAREKNQKSKAQVDYTYTGHARRGRLGWAGWGKKTEVDRVALNHSGYARIR